MLMLVFVDTEIIVSRSWRRDTMVVVRRSRSGRR